MMIRWSLLTLSFLLMLQLSPGVRAAEPGRVEPQGSESDEILYGLRPSQRMQHEVQTSLGVGPLLVLSLGPAISWFGRLQTPYRVFFGFEMHYTSESQITQALLGEFGVSFKGRKGGPWASVLGGATYTWNNAPQNIGFQPAVKARVGWDWMIGDHFSVGLNIGAVYLQMVQFKNSPGPGTSSDSGPTIPVEVAIPLRIWI